MKDYLIACFGGVATPVAYIPAYANTDAEAVQVAQRYIEALGQGPYWRFDLIACNESPLATLAKTTEGNAPFISFETKHETHARPFKC